MWLAAIDPQWAPIIGAFSLLATALGLSERRRRSQARAHPFVGMKDIDQRAAETILTQWKAVLEATQARAVWAEEQERRCDERNTILERRVDELEATQSKWEQERAWEEARREWLASQPRRRKKPDSS